MTWWRSHKLSARLTRLALLLVFTPLASCGGGGSGAGEGTAGFTVDDTFAITYKVSGTATSAALTYYASNGSTSQQTVALPWTYKRDAKTGDLLYISAQNQSDNGSLTSTIAVDGSTFKTATSTGAFVIATASGSCC